MNTPILANERSTRSLKEFDLPPQADTPNPGLGKGAFASVKLVKERKTGSTFALKTIDVKVHEASKSDLHNLKMEILVHRELDHANIVKFHDYIQEDSVVSIILEYAPNGNLYGYMHKQRIIPAHQVFRFFYQTCLAVDYLHRKDILHRDIKPENLLLDRDFNIKLCDFGWSARSLNEKRTTFCGTYEYMAPEIVNNSSYNYKVDIWSLGVLLYELSHGHAPYKGRSLDDIKRSLAKGPITYSPSVNPDVKDLIERILKVNPDERFSLAEILSHPWVKKTLSQQPTTTPAHIPKPVPAAAPTKQALNKENSTPKVWASRPPPVETRPRVELQTQEKTPTVSTITQAPQHYLGSVTPSGIFSKKMSEHLTMDNRPKAISEASTVDRPHFDSFGSLLTSAGTETDLAYKRGLTSHARSIISTTNYPLCMTQPNEKPSKSFCSIPPTSKPYEAYRTGATSSQREPAKPQMYGGKSSKPTSLNELKETAFSARPDGYTPSVSSLVSTKPSLTDYSPSFVNHTRSTDKLHTILGDSQPKSSYARSTPGSIIPSYKISLLSEQVKPESAQFISVLKPAGSAVGSAGGSAYLTRSNSEKAGCFVGSHMYVSSQSDKDPRKGMGGLPMQVVTPSTSYFSYQKPYTTQAPAKKFYTQASMPMPTQTPKVSLGERSLNVTPDARRSPYLGGKGPVEEIRQMYPPRQVLLHVSE